MIKRHLNKFNCFIKSEKITKKTVNSLSLLKHWQLVKKQDISVAFVHNHITVYTSVYIRIFHYSVGRGSIIRTNLAYQIYNLSWHQSPVSKVQSFDINMIFMCIYNTLRYRFKAESQSFLTFKMQYQSIL